MSSSRFIPLTKGQQALVDEADYPILIQIGRWCYSSSGYAVHYFVDDQGQRKTLYMHRMVQHLSNGGQHVSAAMQVDYINGNNLITYRLISVWLPAARAKRIRGDLSTIPASTKA